jgi:L-fuculose-phosphate aldolase
MEAARRIGQGGLKLTYTEERNRIIETCQMMERIGYFLGTWGNVSMRVGNHIILTPSKVKYETMLSDDMVVIDMEGNRVDGERTPTSEKEVHRQIYRANPEVRAIIHAHTKYAMAMSVLDHAEVPCLVEEMSQLLGGGIPITPQYIPAEQHFELGRAAGTYIGDRNALILRNHGPVACGRNMDEAVLAVHVVEKACELYAAVLPASRVMAIPQNAVESERYRYLYKYGNEKT